MKKEKCSTEISIETFTNLRPVSVLEVHMDNGSILKLPLWWYPAKQLKRNKDRN